MIIKRSYFGLRFLCTRKHMLKCSRLKNALNNHPFGRWRVGCVDLADNSKPVLDSYFIDFLVIKKNNAPGIRIKPVHCNMILLFRIGLIPVHLIGHHPVQVFKESGFKRVGQAMIVHKMAFTGGFHNIIHVIFVNELMIFYPEQIILYPAIEPQNRDFSFGDSGFYAHLHLLPYFGLLNLEKHEYANHLKQDDQQQ